MAFRAEYTDIMHNCRVKRYPDGSMSVLVSDRPIFREPGWEAAARPKDGPRPASRPGDERAKRRARQRVKDYARANPELQWFVTFTLDAARVESRYDIAALTKRLSVWLDNRVRRNGLKYVIVPELHQDGAVHWHGLINDALERVESGTVVPPSGGKPRRPRSAAERARWLHDGGRVVYNLPDWGFGFSTSMELYGDRSAAVGYVCKYISKTRDKIGGRWYYSGGQLALPSVELYDTDYEDFSEGAHEWVIEALNARCCARDIEREGGVEVGAERA